MSDGIEQSGGTTHGVNVEIGGNPAAASGTITIDPAAIGSASGSASSATGGDGPAAGTATGKRGRGRPRGSGSKQRAQTEAAQNVEIPRKPFSVDGWTAILLSIHGTLHAVFGAPELELDEKEARQLSEAFRDLAEEYDFNPAPKTMAMTNVLSTVALVYGTRAFAYRTRKATERAEARKNAPNVSQFRTPA